MQPIVALATDFTWDHRLGAVPKRRLLGIFPIPERYGHDDLRFGSDPGPTRSIFNARV